MTTTRRYWMIALAVMTLFTTGADDCLTLRVKHGGIFKIVDNVLYGRPPLGVTGEPSEVTTGQNGDLFEGGLSCTTGCFINADSCSDCGCGDCSDCSSCLDCSDCANCSDCEACSDCGCTIEKVDFAAEHPGQRIPNAVQVRLTSHALEFIEGNLNDLAGAVLPKLDLQGVLNLCSSPGHTTPCTELHPAITALSLGADAREDFSLELRDVQLQGSAADGSLEASLKIFGQSLIPDPADPDNKLIQGGVPVLASIDMTEDFSVGTVHAYGTFNCSIDLDASSGSATDGMELAAKLRLEEVIGSMNTGYSRLVVDSVYFNANSLEPEDISITCTNDSILHVRGGGLLAWCSKDLNFDELLNSGTGVCGATVGLDKGPHGDDGHEDGIRQLVQEIVMRARASVTAVIDKTLSGMLVDVSGNLTDGNGPWRMCQAAAVAADCPSGSTFVAKAGGNAAYCQITGAPARECVSAVLGMQGRTDAGGALASVSPGLSAVVDFLIAAAGPSRAPNGGFNIDLTGGFENLEHNSCVPTTDAPELPVVPIAQLLNANAHPNGRDAHVALGVSEDFINYAAWKIFDSGLLCLNVGTGLDQRLSGDMLGVLFSGKQSLTRLTFPENSKYSAFGITMRPQLAPVISFGDNDTSTDQRLVNVVIPAMELDFYAWAQDRYVRFFTLKADITVGVDLPIVDNTIAIDAGRDLDLGLVNAEILNGDLVTEDHASVVGLLQSVIGVVAGQLGGAIPPISIGDMLGGIALPSGDPLPIGINLGADALAPFSEGDSRFLGVFVDLTPPAATMMLTARPQAQVRVTKVNMPENTDGLFARDFGTGPAPSVEIALSSNAPAGTEVEYSYHLSNSGWSEWSSSNYAIIEDRSLYLQQWHTVYARARLKGQPETTAWTSATADVLIDAAAPDVQVTKVGDAIEIMAFDFLTSAEEIEYRYRNPGEEFGEWAKMGAQTITLDGASADVEVQVRDSVGNIGSNVAALRGIPDPTVADGGCACAVAGPTGQGNASPLALLVSALVFGGILLRRRKRR